MREWEEHMSDFVPADMITFEVPHRSTEVNYLSLMVFINGI